MCLFYYKLPNREPLPVVKTGIVLLTAPSIPDVLSKKGEDSEEI